MNGSTIVFAKTADSARNSFSTLRTLDTEEAVDAGEWRPGAGNCVSHALLVLEVQEPIEVSQESATANDRYLVSRTRMRMKSDCVGDNVLQAELQQFDEWNFGRRLAHARNLQLGCRTPALALAARRRLQNGGLDAFQDKRDDP